MSDIKTNVKEENVSPEEMEELFGVSDAVNMNADEEEETKKPSFFGKDEVDMSFLEEEDKGASGGSEDDEDDESKKDPEADDAKAKDELEQVLNEVEGLEDEEDDDTTKSKGGRQKLDKAGMAQLAETLIKDELLIPFDDDKPLEEYTLDEFKELFKSNIEYRENQLREQTPKEFFEALPHEMQYAAKYIAEGGKDLKGLFKALAASEETKSLDITTEGGQEATIRQYLAAKNFGTPEEIQEEIDNWKDLGKLKDKAEQFKPKLDQMQEQVVAAKVKEQEINRQKQQAAAKKYADDIYNTLSQETLGGIKLNDKVRKMLYNGLIHPTHQSAGGNATNLFGHLIEKHQYLEPNHDIMAQALWLMADPEGFKAEIQKAAKNEAAADTAKKLKIEQQSGKSGSGTEEPEAGRARKPKGLAKPHGGFFKR